VFENHDKEGTINKSKIIENNVKNWIYQDYYTLILRNKWKRWKSFRAWDKLDQYDSKCNFHTNIKCLLKALKSGLS